MSKLTEKLRANKGYRTLPKETRPYALNMAILRATKLANPWRKEKIQDLIDKVVV